LSVIANASRGNKIVVKVAYVLIVRCVNHNLTLCKFSSASDVSMK